MTFINALLAWGALAFTIPLAIHLFFRHRFRTIDWGAMWLLDSVIQRNRRRLRWTNWLLLLLRCLIPVLLAAAMSRPLLHSFRVAPGQLAQTLVLIIDDSQSMNAVDDEGVSRFQKARNQAFELVSDLTRNDEVILLQSGELTAAPSIIAPIDAADQLRQMAPGTGPYTLGDALDAAVSALRFASNPHHRIVIISDFQDGVVPPDIAPQLESIARRIDDSAVTPNISLLSVADRDEDPGNVSIDAIRLESPIAIAGHRTTAAATVRNASDLPVSGADLRWRIDGKVAASGSINVPARAETTVRLNFTPDQVGRRLVTATIDLKDALVNDNRREFALDVTRSIRVAMVDGSPSGEALTRMSDFLFLALQPGIASDDASSDPSNRFEVSRWTPGQLVRSSPASRPDVIILVNVAIDDPARQVIAQHLADGGSLVIFDGPRTAPDQYNRPLLENQDGIISLPASLGPRIKPNADAPRQIAETDQTFSAWAGIAGDQDRVWKDIEVASYRSLTIRPAGPAARTLIRLDDDTVIATIGKAIVDRSDVDEDASSGSGFDGRIIQFALAPHPSDWNLPLRPWFVPLMQQLVLELAGQNNTANLLTGQPLIVPLPNWPDAADIDTEDDDGTPKTFRLVAPNGERLAEKTIDAGQSTSVSQILLRAPTRTAGRYELTVSNVTGGDETATADGATNTTPDRVIQWHLAQLPADESNLRPVLPERLESAVQPFDGRVFTSIAALQDDERLQTEGREVWRPICIALLLCLVLEIALLGRLNSGISTAHPVAPKTNVGGIVS
ncbi:hypothetical protein V7x_20780 [Crateriforma conspicua]|uniref:VWFA domain-containing protein n=1 Tax=Crateriforma conspicua TaxID=2527996 RepID=A0A5C6FVQ6_9PLAN|nr:BatA domain-containing protein [Crateriforma conspicua]TWU66511.1 hypothetical protein V7x_20780 [Crateriforma conspicua]